MEDVTNFFNDKDEELRAARQNIRERRARIKGILRKEGDGEGEDVVEVDLDEATVTVDATANDRDDVNRENDRVQAVGENAGIYHKLPLHLRWLVFKI